MQYETRKVTKLSEIICIIIIDSNILFKGQRVAILAKFLLIVLKELHQTHIGVTKIKQLAQRYMYWMPIDKDIERYIRSCPQYASSPPNAPLHPWEEPDGNWQRVNMDYAGP